MTLLKQKSKTEESIYGNWIFRSNEESINIEITSKKVTLLTKKVGAIKVKEIFDMNILWFGEQLLFLNGGRKYYVKFANDKKLIFGKIEDLILNRILWEVDFLRVKK
jgi:hypothetical protein